MERWNDRVAIATKSCNDCKEVGLFFSIRRKWLVQVWVGLQVPSCKHLVLDCQALGVRARSARLAAHTWHWGCQALGAKPAWLAADPGKQVWRLAAWGVQTRAHRVCRTVRWVLRQDPRFLGLKFLNIINCTINIIIFIIIKSIDIKNIIIYLIINIIHIKNTIICIINIIIFIIVKLINIIRKKYY